MNISISIGDITVPYKLAKTNAPKAYDNESVIDIYDGGEERYVLVRADSWVWQRGRNNSGMYYLLESDGIPFRVISEQLWKRLFYTEVVKHETINS